MAESSHGRAAAACLAAALIAFAACVLAPLRPQGTDTVPGRVGAVAVACTGSFDLRDVDWLADMAAKRQVPYYALAADDDRLVSTFGRAPAVLGAASMAFLAPGQRVTDRFLQRQARLAAAFALALATALLCLALLAVAAPPVALALSASVALSCAGSATLGQALWQQTPALPVLCAALASLFWGRKHRWVLLTVPALLAVLVLLRPPSFALALGLAGAWFVALRPFADRGRIALWSMALAVLAAMPLIFANLQDYGTPLPAGQAIMNAALAPQGQAISLAPSRWLPALAGLLASPGRGLLWYAPLALLGLGLALRVRDHFVRSLAIGAVLHLGLIATFFRWTGGVTFGPRLLAELIWLCALLAAAAGAWQIPWQRKLLAVTMLWTVAVGLLGLARFDPRLWELRHLEQPAALWQVADSPLVALATRPMPRYAIGDAPPGPFRYCQPRPLQPWSAP